MKLWKNTNESLPENGVLVHTLSPGGMEQKLKRFDNLWFVADASMYVYYTPEEWAKIEED